MSILVRVASVALIVSACNQQQQRLGPARRAAIPQMRATVVTVETTMQAPNRTVRHTLVIAGSKARVTDEAESWRLFDVAAATVTFVDDLGRTYRTEPLASILVKRRAALARRVDRELPTADFQADSSQRTILGVPASPLVIRLGGYRRELWFGKHPLIPDSLFAMIHGSSDSSARLGAIVAEVDEALLAARGYPLLDRAEMPFGKKTMIVERSVLRIEQKDVPETLLRIPRGYREVRVPDESRPPFSSRLRGRKAPAVESPPSATTQTVP